MSITFELQVELIEFQESKLIILLLLVCILPFFKKTQHSITKKDNTLLQI